MIIVAPTALKGTIGARAAARAIAQGIRSLGYRNVLELPVSDGGPGLIDALSIDDSDIARVPVRGPLGQETRARLLVRGTTIVIESADVCGLHLVPAAKRDPLRSSTFGLGELLRVAAVGSPREITIGLGGSATMDGGLGMAAALGWRFLDGRGSEIEPVPASLSELEHAVPPDQAWQSPVTALADVETTLYGPTGSARVFGPQKGATEDMIALIDRGLERLTRVLERDAGVFVGNDPGDGAAGGLGAGIRAFVRGEITPGSEWVLQKVEFTSKLAQADLVVTAEGSYDAQSELGKITGALIARARLHRVPVLLIAGRIEGEVPAGVHGVSAAPGETLGAHDLATLARNACAELLPI